MFKKHFMNDKVNYMLFENVFTESELDMIWREVEFLSDGDKLKPPNLMGSAYHRDGKEKKRNKGVFLDSIYSDRTISNYLRLYRKCLIFDETETYELLRIDPHIRAFFGTNFDKTLLSYYDHGDYYETHHDEASYTYVFWLFKEPKKFEGGSFTLNDINITMDVKSNMGVLFPSWANHTVEPIRMKDMQGRNCGRFSFSTFFLIKPN